MKPADTRPGGSVGTVAREHPRSAGNQPQATGDDAEGETGDPDEATGSADLLRYDAIPAELAEGIRSIINRYELRSGTPLPRSIAVTSAVSGEGVTTISQALATLLAQESGEIVCWFDCSWLAPPASPSGQSSATAPDLLEILRDQSRIVSALNSWPQLPQLLRLAPRPVPESKRNVIVRSPEFGDLLEVLIDEFDHVIFDVPALLDYASGLSLMRRCDASLFVVRHRSTSLAQVEQALRATHPTPNVGVLLNQFRTKVPAFLRRQLGG